jgi:hypothetical protein
VRQIFLLEFETERRVLLRQLRLNYVLMPNNFLAFSFGRVIVRLDFLGQIKIRVFSRNLDFFDALDLKVGEDLGFLLIHVLFLVSDGPEVEHLQLLVVVIREFFIVSFVLWQLGSLDCLVSRLYLEIVLAGELDQPMSLFVVDDDEYLLIAETAQLNGFLEEAALPLAEGHIPLKFVFNQP